MKNRPYSRPQPPRMRLKESRLATSPDSWHRFSPRRLRPSPGASDRTRNASSRLNPQGAHVAERDRLQLWKPVAVGAAIEHRPDASRRHSRRGETEMEDNK
jgi:hypothetical protein